MRGTTKIQFRWKRLKAGLYHYLQTWGKNSRAVAIVERGTSGTWFTSIQRPNLAGLHTERFPNGALAKQYIANHAYPKMPTIQPGRWACQ